jgi:hypothetical protein
MLIVILSVSILAEILGFSAVMGSGGSWWLAFVAAQGAGCATALLAAAFLDASRRIQTNTGVTDRFRTTET